MVCRVDLWRLAGSALLALPAVLPAVLPLSAAAESPEALPGPVVSQAFVRDVACDDGTVLLDLRPSAAAVTAGHIPCAVHAPYTIGEGWIVTVDGVFGELPPADDLAALIGGLGISNADRVILAASSAPNALATAARVYWTFKVAGHDAVAILDGGVEAYGSHHPLQSGPPQRPAPAAFEVSIRHDMVPDTAAVAQARSAGAVLVDNNDAEIFLGLSPIPLTRRPGTIAGAVNLPVAWMTTRDGRFAEPDTLVAAARLAGVPTEGAVVAFCTIGQQAALGWFVAHELLGNRDAVLYDGSMAAWGADPALPMDNAAAGAAGVPADR